MSLKVYLGLSLIIASMLLVMYAGYNLNELLFIQGRASSSDLPQYNVTVFTPILIGVLAAIDGSIICGLTRRSSLLFHALANIVYLFSSYRLFLELQEPLTSRLVYYRIFVFFMLAVVLFTIGIIANYFPKSKKSE